MKSKYIEIKKIVVDKSKKTMDFQVLNKKTGLIGWINWYPPFRKYAFTPAQDTIFDPNCLSDLSDFINKLMSEHRNNNGK